MTRQDSHRWRVWRWPTVIAVLTMFGLFSALLGQHGVWFVMSWAALLVPVVLAIYFALLRSSSAPQR